MIEFCFKFSQKNFWGVSKLPKLEENIKFLIFFMSLVVEMWKCKVSLGCKLNFIVDRNEPCGEGATWTEHKHELNPATVEDQGLLQN